MMVHQENVKDGVQKNEVKENVAFSDNFVTKRRATKGRLRPHDIEGEIQLVASILEANFKLTFENFVPFFLLSFSLALGSGLIPDGVLTYWQYTHTTPFVCTTYTYNIRISRVTPTFFYSLLF